MKDMGHVRMETNYVTGITKTLGGSGDPSPVTAYGVYIGMKAAVKQKLKKNSLDGLKVSIQGLGHVGTYLAEYLYNDGVELFVTDIHEDAVENVVKKFDAKKVGLEQIYDLEVDIYAPCALGATINSDTLSRLNCSIIAGAANNVLKDSERHGLEVLKKGILYAPDYAINAGGLINVSNLSMILSPSYTIIAISVIFSSLNFPPVVSTSKIAKSLYISFSKNFWSNS